MADSYRMVGMSGNEPRVCSNCGGRLSKGHPRLEIQLDGVMFVIENVPGLICESCGEVYRDLEDVVQVKTIARMKKVGLFPNDLPAVLLLYAPFKGRRGAAIPGKTVFQKSLWYVRQRLTENRAFPKPNFIPMQGGPWDPNLDRRLDRLKRIGFLLKNPKQGPDGKETFEYSLSPKGLEEVGRYWSSLPRKVVEAVAGVKSEINGLTASQAVEKVHREYPEMWNKSRAERWGISVPEDD